MKRRRKEIEKKRKEKDKEKAELWVRGGGGGGGGMPGGGNYGGSSSSSNSNSNDYGTDTRVEKQQEKAKPKPKASKAKGMALSKSKKKEDFFTALSKEEDLTGPSGPVASLGKKTAAQTQKSMIAEAPKDKAFVSIIEELTLHLEKEGGVKKLDLKGEMKLAVFDPDDAKVLIKLNAPLSKEDGFKCRLHPKINATVYNKTGVLGLKDSTKPFPIGSDNAPVILKWRLQTTEESEVPFTLNFWPNAEDGLTVVSAEYTAEKEGLVMKNVTIAIPCPSQEPPEIKNIDGEFHFDHKNKLLVWSIDEISAENSNGSLEFSIPECDDDDMYPIRIDFTSEKTYANLEIESIEQVDGGAAVDYECRRMLKTEKFILD